MREKFVEFIKIKIAALEKRLAPQNCAESLIPNVVSQ